MFGSIRVCGFFFFLSFHQCMLYLISLNMYILYVCLHVCACSYATCVWPEFYMQ